MEFRKVAFNTFFGCLLLLFPIIIIGAISPILCGIVLFCLAGYSTKLLIFGED